MRILVTGDRNWRNAVRLRDCLTTVMSELAAEELHESYHVFTIVHGFARGADYEADVVVQLLREDAELYGLAAPEWPEDHPANWEEYRRAAGPIRNQEMLDSGIDYVVAFHNDIKNSKGTKDMMRRCIKAGIPGRLFTEEGEEEWQVD